MDPHYSSLCPALFLSDHISSSSSHLALIYCYCLSHSQCAIETVWNKSVHIMMMTKIDWLRKYQSVVYTYLLWALDDAYVALSISRALNILCLDPWPCLSDRQITCAISSTTQRPSIKTKQTSISYASPKTLKMTHVRGRMIKRDRCRLEREGTFSLHSAVLYAFLIPCLFKSQTINYEVNRV
jgi:hypothetical protein